MAKKPKKACRYKNCKKVTTSHTGFCPAHRKHVNQAYELTRETATQRGYTSRTWQKLRKMVLNNEPLCRDPFHAHKRYTESVIANEVDHMDGNRTNNSMDNLQPLCKHCHSRKTALEHEFGRGKVHAAPYSTK